ncbi:MAG: B12-binding domain-containing radical SAM protein [Thermoplasmata archaeon]|nr:B12-binding domain-containing radical SAM protein [Thermoplasmata archaeon]
MRVLLILAHTNTKVTSLHELIYNYLHPSFTLEQLAAITPKQHQVELVDMRYQKVDFEWNGNIIGISCRTVSANTAYRVADEFRRRGKTVVLGGYHPSAMPEEAKQHADSVVIGEAELTWPQLLKDFENGKLKPFYRQNRPVDPELIPSPKRMSKKFPFFSVASIQATRGCPFKCSFCPIHKVQGYKYRTRPIDKVIDEIQSIPSRRLFFVDNSLTIDLEYTKMLFKKMKGLDKRFNCYANINVLGKDDELLRLASDAGCELWIVGFETINQKTIDSIGKTTNVVKEYAKAVKKIHDYGMMIQGLFVFGFDYDTPDIFDRTLEAIYKWELDKAGFAILTPFPGTSLFRKFEKEGRIITRDWSKYNLKNVVFKPKNMSEQMLFDGTNRLLNKFYSFPNMLRRIFRDERLDLQRLINRSLQEISSKQLYKILGW